MDNTSATGGPLLPLNQIPTDDQALDRFLHDLYTGITGLDPTLVRPLWNITPGNMPKINTEWMSQGIIDRRQDFFPTQHFDDTQGMILMRNQELDNLVSLYGDQAGWLADLLIDGLSLTQNRDPMTAAGLYLVDIGKPKNASMLINEQWYKRIDVVITYRRNITRVYPILSVKSATIGMNEADDVHEYSQQININK